MVNDTGCLWPIAAGVISIPVKFRVAGVPLSVGEYGRQFRGVGGFPTVLTRAPEHAIRVSRLWSRAMRQVILYGPQRVTESHLTLASPRDSEIGLARQ